jgi:hypothetical protein
MRSHFEGLLYLPARHPQNATALRIMSDPHEGHFPDEAEENAIGGPVLFVLICVGMLVLIIWAAS